MKRIPSPAQSDPSPLPPPPLLQDQIPTSVEKAAASGGNSADAVRRATAFGNVLRMHFSKVGLRGLRRALQLACCM
jgi:hypothetical protein